MSRWCQSCTMAYGLPVTPLGMCIMGSMKEIKVVSSSQSRCCVLQGLSNLVLILFCLFCSDPCSDRCLSVLMLSCYVSQSPSYPCSDLCLSVCLLCKHTAAGGMVATLMVSFLRLGFGFSW